METRLGATARHGDPPRARAVAGLSRVCCHGRRVPHRTAADRRGPRRGRTRTECRAERPAAQAQERTMDFDFTLEQETFRKEVRLWLECNLPDDLRGRGFAASRAEPAEVAQLR